MLDMIKDNTLIVCPNGLKKKILKQLSSNKKLINVSFLTIEQYKKYFYFDYDYRAILYLCNTYNLSVDNAKEIIENLYYVEEKDYHNKKLNDLVRYKKELKSILIYNPFFKSYIKNKHLIVTGYGRLDIWTKLMFNKDTLYFEYKIVDKKYTVFVGNKIDEEIEWVYNRIFELLNNNVDINKIFLLNLSDEYTSYMKRYNTYYPFNVGYKKKQSLYGTEIGKNFLNKLDNKDDLNEYLLNSNIEYSDVFINIINKYVGCNLVDVKELIIDDLKHTFIQESYSNVVNCVDMFTEFNDDEHVFLLGFNDSVPTMKSDIQYITNNIRELVNLPKIEEENEIIKVNTINYLSNIKNLYLSYCKDTPFTSHDKQTLFNNIVYEKIENENVYSDKLNDFKYCVMLDDLNKYGTLSNGIEDMCTTYKDNYYGKYDNSYKPFALKRDFIKLSYTSMNAYYKCSFFYYLNYVLKLNEFENTFNTNIGTLTHFVLQNLIKDPSVNFDELWNKGIEANTIEFTTFKEKFFSNKIKEEIRIDYDILLKQKESYLFDAVDCEKEITIDVNKNIKFNGTIDKILKLKDMVCLIDYKTSKEENINDNLYEYGLSLQLPIYLYLLKNSYEYQNSKIVGFYLQHLINYNKAYNKDKTLFEIKSNSMKLDGFTSGENNRYKIIDKDLENGKSSNVVKTLALKTDGDFNKKGSKTIGDKEIDDLVLLVKDKILEAGNGIINNKFNINPKIYANKNISCSYCCFKDICYKRISDSVELERKANNGPRNKIHG